MGVEFNLFKNVMFLKLWEPVICLLCTVDYYVINVLKILIWFSTVKYKTDRFKLFYFAAYFGCDILIVIFWLWYSDCDILIVIFWLWYSNCDILIVSFWL